MCIRDRGRPRNSAAAALATSECSASRRVSASAPTSMRSECTGGTWESSQGASASSSQHAACSPSTAPAPGTQT
eukprot:7409585-Alexandrium_andersonii.AAC.1